MVGASTLLRRLSVAWACPLLLVFGSVTSRAQTSPTSPNLSGPALTIRSETKIDSLNPVDPDGIWSAAELKDLLGGGQLRALTRADPSIRTYEAPVGDDKHIVSVVVGPNCSTSSCDLRHIVVHPNGAREVVDTTTEEFAAPEPEATRSLSALSPFRLSPDGTDILTTPDLVERGLSGESVASLVNAGMPRACAPYAAKVSSSEGSFSTRSSKGCLGAFQFCPGTFEQYFDGTQEEFLASPKRQVEAWIRYEKVQWSQATRNNLQAIIGDTICDGRKCVKADASAILMGCQFGCGRNGKLYNLTRMATPRDCNARSVKDGFGTSVCSYLVKGAGYEASCFVGEDRSLLAVDVEQSTPDMTGEQSIDIIRLRVPVQQFDKVGAILKALNQH